MVSKSYTYRTTIEVKRKLLMTHCILSFEVITKLILMELSTTKDVSTSISEQKSVDWEKMTGQWQSTLESNNKDFCWYSTHKTAGLAGLACGASIRPNLLEGEVAAQKQKGSRSDSWNHRAFRSVRMSNK